MWTGEVENEDTTLDARQNGLSGMVDVDTVGSWNRVAQLVARTLASRLADG